MNKKTLGVSSLIILASLLLPLSVSMGAGAPPPGPRPEDPTSAMTFREKIRERAARLRGPDRYGTSAEGMMASEGGAEFSRNVELVGRWAEGQIYDMAARGNTLFLASGGYLQIVDFSNPRRPVELGRLMTPSVAVAIALGENHAYVVDSMDGLGVIDIADPNRPTEVGRCDYNHSNQRSSADDVKIAAHGDFVYLSQSNPPDWINLLRVFDVSNPSQPTEAGSARVPGGDMVAADGFIYVASGGVTIVDVSDPAHCNVVGTYTETSFDANAIAVVNGYALVVGVGSSGWESGWKRNDVMVVDLSDPSAPRRVGSIPISAEGVAVRDQYAYFTTDWGILIYDVSDPRHPVGVSQREMSGQWYWLNDIVVTDRLAFSIPGWWPDHRVVAYDVSIPARPMFAAEYVTGGASNCIVKEESLVYTADYTSGLTILDVSNPSEPTEIGQYGRGHSITTVDVFDGIAYLGMDPGLRLIDVSDPTHPAKLGCINDCPEDWCYWYVAKILVNDRFAYLGIQGDYSTTVRVIDVSDPMNPKQVGSIYLGLAFFNGMAIDGDYLYVVGDHDMYGSDLQVISVADPTHPTRVGKYESEGYLGGVAVSGRLVYLVGDKTRVIDVSDPANPVELGSCDTQGSSCALEEQGPYLHVASGWGGYRVIDASEPRHPVEVAYFNRGNDAAELVFDSGHAFVGDANNGLYVLSFYPTLSACVDIDPDVCPNVLKLVEGEENGGFITVALYGTSNLRAEDIDVPTLRLAGCVPAGPSQLRDVGRAAWGETPDIECVDRPRDGRADLVVRFSSSGVLKSLGDIYDGPERELSFTGILLDGRRLIGADRVTIVPASHDEDAPTKWAAKFGGPDHQWIECVAADGEGNLILTGYFRGSVDFGGSDLVNAGPDDAFLAKLDRHGRHIWSRSFCDTRPNDPIGKAVAADASGNVYFAGEFYGQVCLGGDTLFVPDGRGSIFLAKYGPNGNHLWSRKIGSTSSQFVAGMGIEPSGEVVLAGTWDQYSPPSHAYAFITKIDTDGHDEWYKQFSGSDDVLASDVGLDPAGNIILVGSFEGTVNFGGSTLINEQSRSLYLSKFDPKGQHIWSHGYGEHEYGSAWSVATDADGNVVLAGDFRGDIDFGGGPLKSKGDYDIFIVKFDPDALFRWNRSFGDHETQCVSDISITDAGSILVTGCFWGEVDFGGRRLRSLGESDIYVAALDKDGGHLWSDGFGDPADDQSGVSIAIDDQGKVIVGGDFRGTVDFGSGPLQSEDEIDIFLVKFGSNIAARGNPGPILTGGADGTPARTLQLCQNFPNPFNPTTTIPVEIPERTNATLVIYDVAGRVVRTLLDGVAGAGRKEIIWDGRDFGGNSVSSGVYFCRFAAGRVVQTKKLILLK